MWNENFAYSFFIHITKESKMRNIISNPKYPFQQRVNEFTRPRSNVGIFTFYGSGKSYMGLEWLDSHQNFPTILFGPKNLTPQWRDEIHKHSNFDCIAIPTIVNDNKAKRLKQIAKSAQIYLCGYDALRSPPVRQALLDKRFRSMLIDESTAVKNSRSQRWKGIYDLRRHLSHCCLLSGKPMLESPIDLYSQMYMLDGGKTFGRAFWRFRMQYFTPGPPWKPYDWELKWGAETEIGRRAASHCIYIPREEIENQLPKQEFQRVYLTMPPDAMYAYEEMRKEFELQLDTGEFVDTMWAVAKAAKMHQIAQGFLYYKDEVRFFHAMKEDWLATNLPIITTNTPVLIWTSYKYIAERLYRMCRDQLLIPTSLFYGGQKANENETAKQDFQNGKTQILILTSQAGFRGHNLQRAGTAIFHDNGHKAEHRANALERNSRIDSKDKYGFEYLQVIDLCMRNTCDDIVLDSYEEKIKLADGIMKHIKG